MADSPKTNPSLTSSPMATANGPNPGQRGLYSCDCSLDGNRKGCHIVEHQPHKENQSRHRFQIVNGIRSVSSEQVFQSD